MNSAPNNGSGCNEMNQPHVDQYQYYDGSQTIHNSNMGNVMVQPMDQQSQMYDPSMECTPPIMMGYEQQQYDERFGNQIHLENMQTQAFHDHPQPLGPPPSFNPCPGNANPHRLCDPVAPQQYHQAANQNMGNNGHPEMPSYPSSVNSMMNETWHSSNPPSVYNVPMDTSTMNFQSSCFPNSAQQQPSMSYQQPPNYGPVYNTVPAQMPTSSRNMMNMDFRNASAGQKVGAPIKVACEKHRLEKVKSCRDCKNLENKSHTYSVTKNNKKKAVERGKLEKQVSQLTKTYEFLKQNLIEQRNLPQLSESYKKIIDDALLYEPDNADENPTIMSPATNTAEELIPSEVKKSTLAVRKYRETAKQKETELDNKREILTAKMERIVDVLKLMKDAECYNIVTLTQL